MRLLTVYLSTVLFSLVSASACSPDAKESTITTTFSNKLEVHFHGTVETLNIVYPPSEEHISHSRPSNAQLTLPQLGPHILGIVVTAMLVVSAAYLSWKHSSSTHTGNRSHSAHQTGRNEAVSGPAPGGDGPLHDSGQAKAPPRRRLSAAVVFADNAPHSSPPLRRFTDLPTPLIEEPEGLDDFTIDQEATSGGNRFQRLVATGRHVLRSWSWHPINQPEPAVIHLSARPPDPRSLHRSLYKGSKDLDGHLALDQCVFFVVGVDTPGHEDAENDTKYLQQMFESPAHGPPPRYKCIYGSDATRVKIRETIHKLLGEAQAVLAPPRMFMLFTGTGDENNMMYLSKGKPLSESDLTDWLSPFTNQTNEPAVSMLFDICREANSRLAVISQSAEMAWSCSVGEFAFAIRFSKREDKLFPRSIFLIAIFLAAHHTDAHNQDDHFFQEAFASHIKQLSAFIRLAYDKQHQDRCPQCPEGRLCDPPKAQTPDLRYAGRAVTSLGMLIATHFPRHAREVFVEVERRMLAGGFPRRLCPLFDPSAAQSNRRDGKRLKPHATPRVKGRLASVESAHLLQAH
ncbi:hypothetical protein RSOL_207640 [Rhizoctonia solani AG-3 Rhs1AP]|uniref:Transmembrane protein n=1 Tax=Rhizoctonia solani AG-3 Rhs1AP TaxID=1086054 RepID=X8J785_9AGAM|nr:hypothetical protein RSOL_207640 [Rhizoctonia solani AG-3 Rhs1AP]